LLARTNPRAMYFGRLLTFWLSVHAIGYFRRAIKGRK
jgi:hypothetical protein